MPHYPLVFRKGPAGADLRGPIGSVGLTEGKGQQETIAPSVILIHQYMEYSFPKTIWKSPFSTTVCYILQYPHCRKTQ